MLESTRFVCPSACLTLKSLLKRTRNGLWIGVGCALTIHLSLTQIGSSDGEQKAAKPLTTQFVKRQPRLTKPLELKKRPRPKRRALQRRMVSVRVRAERRSVSSRFQPSQVLESLARPRVGVSRLASFTPVELEPTRAIAEVISSTKESKNVVNMSLEMMDVDALDTGKHHALVIQDPTDKRNVRGFFHIALANPLSMRYRNAYNREDRVNYGIVRLAQRMNELTSIKTDVTHRVSFDDREFFKTPWVYLFVVRNIEPTESEMLNLGHYLLHGGFFMAEGDALDVPSVSHMGYKYLMRFIEGALASQGWLRDREWSHEVLPDDHPLFHVYYDFNGAPAGLEIAVIRRLPHKYTHPDGVDPTVRGIVTDGRLTVLTTNQKYGLAWGSFGPDGYRSSLNVYGDLDPRIVFEFGINTIIFALTQEGSITNRVMDDVRY